MVRQDIVATLRNALERGEPIQKVRQSLINSGYSARDVDDAANYLTSGTFKTPKKISQQPQNQTQQMSPQQPQRQMPPLQNMQQPQRPSFQQRTQPKRNQIPQQPQRQMPPLQNMQQPQQPQRQMPRPLPQQQPLQQTPQRTETKSISPKSKSSESKIPWGIILLISSLMLLLGLVALVIIFRQDIFQFFDSLFN